MVQNALVLLAGLQIASLPFVAAKKTLCSQVGWDAGHGSFASSSSGGFASCSAACSQNKKCKSFAYSSDDCQLYNKAVKGNIILDKDSPYTFNDKACQNTAPICNQLGSWIGDDKYTLDIIAYWGHPASERTKLACYNDCLKEASCMSYAWNEGACSLWSAPLAGNFQPASDSVADFYDMSCGQPPATSDDITTTSDVVSATTADATDAFTSDSFATTTTSDVESSATDAPTTDASTTDASAGAATTITYTIASATDDTAATTTAAADSASFSDLSTEPTTNANTVSTSTPLEYITTTSAASATEATASDSGATTDAPTDSNTDSATPTSNDTTSTNGPQTQIDIPADSTSSVNDTVASLSTTADDSSSTSDAPTTTDSSTVTEGTTTSDSSASTLAVVRRSRHYHPRRRSI